MPETCGISKARPTLGGPGRCTFAFDDIALRYQLASGRTWRAQTPRHFQDCHRHELCALRRAADTMNGCR